MPRLLSAGSSPLVEFSPLFDRWRWPGEIFPEALDHTHRGDTGGCWGGGGCSGCGSQETPSPVVDRQVPSNYTVRAPVVVVVDAVPDTTVTAALLTDLLTGRDGRILLNKRLWRRTASARGAHGRLAEADGQQKESQRPISFAIPCPSSIFSPNELQWHC